MEVLGKEKNATCVRERLTPDALIILLRLLNGPTRRKTQGMRVRIIASIMENKLQQSIGVVGLLVQHMDLSEDDVVDSIAARRLPSIPLVSPEPAQRAVIR